MARNKSTKRSILEDFNKHFLGNEKYIRLNFQPLIDIYLKEIHDDDCHAGNHEYRRLEKEEIPENWHFGYIPKVCIYCGNVVPLINNEVFNNYI